jgi:hypothetical protein
MLAALILGLIVSVGGMLVGAWWVPFTVGVVIGLAERRARFAIPAGGTIGFVAWALPLSAEHLRFGLGPSADSLAAIMGFTGQPAVPVILTCLVGLLLGMTGAWLASAAVRLVAPATR